MRLVLTASFLTSLMLSSTAMAKAPDADNTAQNKNSTRKEAVTAEKQDNKKSDVESLAAIRKAIVAKDGLSMNAKNVKILYSKGVCTLRGPVDSADEKNTVESVVKSCDCVTSVKNLLTVTAKSK
ncbi:MAG TPA: BON domain-containing protein [Drouetiella sp.]